MILQPSLILQLLGPPQRILRLGLSLPYFLHCPWDQSRTDGFLIASLSDLKQEAELHNSPTSHVFLRFAELSKNSKNLNYISGAVTFLISHEINSTCTGIPICWLQIDTSELSQHRNGGNLPKVPELLNV